MLVITAQHATPLFLRKLYNNRFIYIQTRLHLLYIRVLNSMHPKIDKFNVN